MMVRPSEAELPPADRARSRRRALLFAALLLALVALPAIFVISSERRSKALASRVVSTAHRLLPNGIDGEWSPLAGNGLEGPRARAVLRALEQRHPGAVVTVADPDVRQPSCAGHGDAFWHQSLGGRVERLGAFVAAAGGLAEFEDPLRLAADVRSLTEHGPAQSPPARTDPLLYLELAERSPLTCRYFSVIYLSALASRGYTARLIGLSSDGRRDEHAVVEVYLPDQGRWVLVDPDFNIVYRKDGRLLNALELQQLWRSVREDVARTAEREERTRLVLGTGMEVVELGEPGAELRRTNLFGSRQGMLNLQFFEFVTYSARNDFISDLHPAGHPARWLEYLTRADGDGRQPPGCLECVVVRDPECLYWSPAATAVALASYDPRADAIEVELSTSMPNFSHFEQRQGAGEWQRLDGSAARVELAGEPVHAWFRPVNLAGLRGEVSELRIELGAS